MFGFFSKRRHKATLETLCIDIPLACPVNCEYCFFTEVKKQLGGDNPVGGKYKEFVSIVEEGRFKEEYPDANIKAISFVGSFDFTPETVKELKSLIGKLIEGGAIDPARIKDVGSSTSLSFPEATADFLSFLEKSFPNLERISIQISQDPIKREKIGGKAAYIEKLLTFLNRLEKLECKKVFISGVNIVLTKKDILLLAKDKALLKEELSFLNRISEYVVNSPFYNSEKLDWMFSPDHYNTSSYTKEDGLMLSKIADYLEEEGLNPIRHFRITYPSSLNYVPHCSATFGITTWAGEYTCPHQYFIRASSEKLRRDVHKAYDCKPMFESIPLFSPQNQFLSFSQIVLLAHIGAISDIYKDYEKALIVSSLFWNTSSCYTPFEKFGSFVIPRGLLLLYLNGVVDRIFRRVYYEEWGLEKTGS